MMIGTPVSFESGKSERLGPLVGNLPALAAFFRSLSSFFSSFSRLFSSSLAFCFSFRRVFSSFLEPAPYCCKNAKGKFVKAAKFFRVLRPWMKESLGDMLDDDPEKKIHF
jgi:hypothetical protein